MSALLSLANSSSIERCKKFNEVTCIPHPVNFTATDRTIITVWIGKGFKKSTLAKLKEKLDSNESVTIINS